jgi:unsaturated rhamnogalacturonyl hydrolase
MFNFYEEKSLEKFLSTIGIFLISLILCSNAFAEGNDNRTPEDIITSIINRVIKESSFKFNLAPQKEVVGMQILDFTKQYKGIRKGVAYAYSNINADSSETVILGISATNGIEVFINDELINHKNLQNAFPREIAYGMFVFGDTIMVNLKKGINKILIKASLDENPKIFVRQISDDPESEGTIKFNLTNFIYSKTRARWVFVGPFLDSKNVNDDPETEIKQYYKVDGKILDWTLPKEELLRELNIDSTNAFTKDSYLDWNYANGITMTSIWAASKLLNNNNYLNFVKHYCNFAMENMDYFRWQYDSLYAIRGSYSRIFRRSMLDDAGSSTLPFASLAMENSNSAYRSIVKEMVDYIENDQPRLKDGTLCRPEPEKMTVWADDLFMSVPLLLRAAKIFNNTSYYDDAVKQIINFHHLLFDKDKNLYKHGWFEKTDQKSIAFWGRANGWIAWSLAETLTYLPKNYNGYNKILNLFQEDVKGLVGVQDKDGMWHQVLDHHESYEETSCTAIFIVAIARGVRNGWIDKSYASNAVKAWQALKKRIEPDGIVHGICRGTGIGNGLTFYFKRPTLDNDPRGLGAVIMAGVEISKLINKE